ncbi:hypothetical protein Shal_0866 [Shewanella halifaxensis HAW-EB4]|uniref:Outer membrane protein beta-barrel domain-containing protein n=1 Tax=Shewanella halifaxensis (strain HAW-EB4) TaxID=458817 RepID=B0TUE1_SHEHH|nr:outer membrane beta-barrel protein [Shewanella halifaxensis]ABZ75441.1 hypothetical protein Shal_0866 [Shewanella halifaxensis HAW-EB4]
MNKLSTLALIVLLTASTSAMAVDTSPYLGAGVADIDGVNFVELKGGVVFEGETFWGTVGLTYGLGEDIDVLQIEELEEIQIDTKIGVKFGDDYLGFHPYLTVAYGEGKATIYNYSGDDNYIFVGAGAEVQIAKNYVISAEFGNLKLDELSEISANVTRINFAYKF